MYIPELRDIGVSGYGNGGAGLPDKECAPSKPPRARITTCHAAKDPYLDAKFRSPKKCTLSVL